MQTAKIFCDYRIRTSGISEVLKFLRSKNLQGELCVLADTASSVVAISGIPSAMVIPIYDHDADTDELEKAAIDCKHQILKSEASSGFVLSSHAAPYGDLEYLMRTKSESTDLIVLILSQKTGECVVSDFARLRRVLRNNCPILILNDEEMASQRPISVALQWSNSSKFRLLFKLAAPLFSSILVKLHRVENGDAEDANQFHEFLLYAKRLGVNVQPFVQFDEDADVFFNLASAENHNVLGFASADSFLDKLFPSKFNKMLSLVKSTKIGMIFI